MLFMFIKIIFKKVESINCEKVVNNIYMSMQVFNTHFSFRFMCFFFILEVIFSHKKRTIFLKYFIYIK